MSRSYFAAAACCSKTDAPCKDKVQQKKPSLTKLLESASQRLNFWQVFEERSVVPRPLLSVPSETLSLRQQQPCQNISFKSLPPLGARDSLENILRIHRFGEYPRRNLLKSFVKANDLEKRPRRRLCQNKAESISPGSQVDHPFRSQTSPEVNVKKLRYQLAKEKKVFNSFNIGKFSQKIKNRIKGTSPKGIFDSTLHQGLSYEEVVSLCEENVTIGSQILSENSDILQPSLSVDVCDLESSAMPAVSASDVLRPFERLNLSQTDCQSHPANSETLDTPRPVQARDSCAKLKNSSNASWPRWTDPDKRDTDTKFSDEIRVKIVRLPKEFGESKCNSSSDLDSQTSKVDFSSGDDSRNLSLNSKSAVEVEDDVCKQTEGTDVTRGGRDEESRRRLVQWNSEVDVIYYAGDADGGKVVRREREPLREEADQQARHSGFIQLALNKNMMSTVNPYQFLDPWVTVFHK